MATDGIAEYVERAFASLPKHSPSPAFLSVIAAAIEEDDATLATITRTVATAYLADHRPVRLV